VGPIRRSEIRERVKLSFFPNHPGPFASSRSRWKQGTIVFVLGKPPDLLNSAEMLRAMRRALIKRDAAVAITDGFQSYDLQIILPGLARVSLNALPQEAGQIALKWRIHGALIRDVYLIGVTFAVVVVALGISIDANALVKGLALSGASILYARLRVRRVGPLLSEAAGEAAHQ